MDPVNALAVTVKNISIDGAVPQLNLLQAPPLVSLCEQDERVGQLLALLQPHVCEEEFLDRVRFMSKINYCRDAPSRYFTTNEAQQIAKVAAALLQAEASEDAWVVSRKKTLLSWKIIAADQGASLLLLPKKNYFPDLIGCTKMGRVALLCRLGADATLWKTQEVWHLSANKNKEINFFNAREVERKLASMVDQSMFARCYYDFAKTSKRVVTRSCYYERHQCLFFWAKGQPISLLLKVALAAAKKVAALHEKQIVLVDFKSDNLLVTQEHDVLICDVDQVLIGKYERVPTDGGTQEFFPPELINYKHTDGKSGDIFAFGCMLLEMLSGLGPPWVANGTQRKCDNETLNKYRKAANLAKINLEAGRDSSAKKMLFLLAQWALNPRREMRPTMNTICGYLSRVYEVENDIDQAELAAYFSIET